jgi:hypothetical protein
MTTIQNARTPWVTVADGKILSAHSHPERARKAAAKNGGYVYTVPTIGRAAQITLTIGQRVRIDAGMVLPV